MTRRMTNIHGFFKLLGLCSRSLMLLVSCSSTNTQQTVTVHQHKQETIGANETGQIGGNRLSNIARSQSEMISKNRTIVVGGDPSEPIGKT